VELSLFAEVTRMFHRDVGLGLAEFGVVRVEGFVAVVEQVAFGVVQGRIRFVVDLSIPEINE
jgi:hypothetical protein